MFDTRLLQLSDVRLQKREKKKRIENPSTTTTAAQMRFVSVLFMVVSIALVALLSQHPVTDAKIIFTNRKYYVGMLNKYHIYQSL